MELKIKSVSKLNFNLGDCLRLGEVKKEIDYRHLDVKGPYIVNHDFVSAVRVQLAVIFYLQQVKMKEITVKLLKILSGTQLTLKRY